MAVVTPFTLDGAVDYPALKRLIRYQLDSGVDFLCILATTGETPCLTLDEKNKITELVKEENKGLVPINVRKLAKNLSINLTKPLRLMRGIRDSHYLRKP